MNRKGFLNIILLVAVIIVIASIAGYFVLTRKSRVSPITQQPISKSVPSSTTGASQPIAPVNSKPESNNLTTSSSWKTYRNEKYGFEFRHPADAEVTGTNKVLETPQAFSPSDECNVITEVVDNSMNLSLQQIEAEEIYRISFVSSELTGEVTLVTTSSLMKSGIIGALLKLGGNSQPLEQIAIFPLTNKKIYIYLDFNGCNADMVAKILSTFKFFPPSLSTEF